MIFKNKLMFRYAGVVLLGVLSLSASACFIFSLDSYDGTLTRFFPESVGRFERSVEMTPIPTNTFIPEARALTRDVAYALYGRKGGYKRAIHLTAFGIRSSEKAVNFLALYRDSLLKEGYEIKEEGAKKTWFAQGDRLILTRSAEKSPSRNAEMIIIWRNGAVIFAAQSSDEDHVQKLTDFERAYSY